MVDLEAPVNARRLDCMERHYCGFTNKQCEYFPCHKGIDVEQFNCMFCYCPLYAMGPACGGEFCYLPDGTKDCSMCGIPHGKHGFDYIMEHSHQLRELGKERKVPD